MNTVTKIVSLVNSNGEQEGAKVVSPVNSNGEQEDTKVVSLVNSDGKITRCIHSSLKLN